MLRKQPIILLGLLLSAILALSACAAPAAPADAPSDTAASEGESTGEESGGAVQMPEIVDGKYNVAFVYVGPIGDGGWTYAHNDGRLYLEETLGDAVHTAYIEMQFSQLHLAIWMLQKQWLMNFQIQILSMYLASKRMIQISPTSLVRWKV